MPARVQMFGKQPVEVGLLIDGSAIHAAEYRWHDGWHRVWSESEKLPFTLFGKDSFSSAELKTTENVIARVAQNALTKNRLVNVAVADPAVHFAFFTQKSVPNNRSDQVDLCRSRFDRQGSTDAHAMEIAFQYEKGDDSLYSVLAMGMEHRRMEFLRKALVGSGVRVRGVVPDVVARFNQHFDRLTEGRCTAAMVTVHDSYWSMLIWDSEGCVRYCRSLWRRDESGEGIDRILEDIGHITRSYARGDASRAIRKFFVDGNGEGARSLTGLMQTKLFSGEAEARTAGDGRLFFLPGDETSPAEAAALGSGI